MRLIDADALYRKTAEWEEEAMQIVNKASETEADGFNWIRWSTILGERSAFKHDIADAPAVDAEPVRHGRWIYKPAWSNADWGVYLCSECNKPYWWNTDHYCPNCGAKMDGGGEEDETD